MAGNRNTPADILGIILFLSNVSVTAGVILRINFFTIHNTQSKALKFYSPKNIFYADD